VPAGDRPTNEEFLENLAAAAHALQEKLPQVRHRFLVLINIEGSETRLATNAFILLSLLAAAALLLQEKRMQVRPTLRFHLPKDL